MRVFDKAAFKRSLPGSFEAEKIMAGWDITGGLGI
jgi:hypothetical protein